MSVYASITKIALLDQVKDLAGKSLGRSTPSLVTSLYLIIGIYYAMKGDGAKAAGAGAGLWASLSGGVLPV